MYRFYNPNPRGKRVGDCVVRALCKALDKDWETTATGLFVQSLRDGDMPSADAVWGAYLKSEGWQRRVCEDACSVAAFADSKPEGKYVLALGGHVVCVENGDWFDTWDSGDRAPIYYYERMDY